MIGIPKLATNLLLRQEVEQRLKLGRSAIYDRLNPDGPYFDPGFPKPIRLSDGKNSSVRWIESEIDEYIEARITATRQAEQKPPVDDWRAKLQQSKATGKGGAA